MEHGHNFSTTTRQKIIDKQNNTCLNCGEVGKLSVHHIVPKNMGGESNELNGVGLCRGKDTNECHTKADILTIMHNVPFSAIAEEGIAPIMDMLEISTDKKFPKKGLIWEDSPYEKHHKTRKEKRAKRKLAA